MAEVYADKGTHKGNMSWVLMIAVLAAIAIAIIYAVAR